MAAEREKKSGRRPGRRGVLIADAREMFAQTLASTLAGENVSARAVGCHRQSVLEAVADEDPAVVLLAMPPDGCAGAIDLTASLVELDRTVVLLVDEHTDEVAVAQAIAEGAAGLTNTADPIGDLIGTIDDAVHNRPLLTLSKRYELENVLRRHRTDVANRLRPFRELTLREQTVLVELMEGKRADRIAADDGVSITTVRSQIRSILLKLSVGSQLEAVALAHHSGWIPEARAV